MYTDDNNSNNDKDMKKKNKIYTINDKNNGHQNLLRHRRKNYN